MELYPYFMGPGNLPNMTLMEKKRKRGKKKLGRIGWEMEEEQERHFGLRPPCLSCQSKSGQFICSKSGQFYLLTTDFFVPSCKYPKGLNRILGIFLPDFISLCLCLYPACIWVIDIPVAKRVKEIAFFVNSHTLDIRPFQNNRRILFWNNHLFLCQLP